MRNLLRRIRDFLLECLGNAVVCGVVFTILYLPYAILAWILTQDSLGLVVISMFGAIVGVLAGIGRVFIDWFSEESRGNDGQPNLGNWLLNFYVAPLKPSWWVVIELGQKIKEKDYSKQRPGRLKRGLVGAAAFMFFIVFIFGAVALTSPMPPAPGFVPYFLVLILFFGVVGGVAGALTDSR